jgi:hypothetical protein
MKRLRRTNSELARGLTAEEAMVERKALQAMLAAAGNKPMTPEEATKAYNEAQAEAIPLDKDQVERIVRNVIRQPKVVSTKSCGEFIIKIVPIKGVDKDYFGHLSARIEVPQDNDFYKWVDHYLEKVYDGDMTKLFQDILNKGIGEVINTVHFDKDIK